MSDFLDLLGTSAQEIARASVDVSSNITPPFTVPLYDTSGTDANGTNREPSIFDPLLRMLKPSIVVRSRFGDMSFAPWGAPDPTVGTAAAAALASAAVIVVGFALYGVLRLAE